MNDTWIKITAVITLILFVAVIVISATAIGCGFLLGGGSNDLLQGSVDIADPNNPGVGWLALGGIFGSLFGGFIAAFIIVIGIIGIIADVIVCLPMCIGWCIWKKTGSKKAYQICCIISVSLLCMCCLLYFL